MTWDGPSSFSYSVDAFLARLKPHGQPEGERAFPDKIDRALVRFQGPETDQTVVRPLREDIHARRP